MEQSKTSDGPKIHGDQTAEPVQRVDMRYGEPAPLESSPDQSPFSREFEQALLDGINGERAAAIQVRENYYAMLLIVAARIFPGVATAWAGAPEMVARHAVDIAQLLVDAVDAKVNEKYPVKSHGNAAGTE